MGNEVEPKERRDFLKLGVKIPSEADLCRLRSHLPVTGDARCTTADKCAVRKSPVAKIKKAFLKRVAHKRNAKKRVNSRRAAPASGKSSKAVCIAVSKIRKPREEPAMQTRKRSEQPEPPRCQDLRARREQMQKDGWLGPRKKGKVKRPRMSCMAKGDAKSRTERPEAEKEKQGQKRGPGQGQRPNAGPGEDSFARWQRRLQRSPLAIQKHPMN